MLIISLCAGSENRLNAICQGHTFLIWAYAVRATLRSVPPVTASDVINVVGECSVVDLSFHLQNR
jgi:hypothetical protein